MVVGMAYVSAEGQKVRLKDRDILERQTDGVKERMRGVKERQTDRDRQKERPR